MEQLIKAMLSWLEGAGFAAARQMPEGMFPELEGTVVAVGMEKAEAKEAGLFSYLGVTEAEGRQVSLYGRRLEAEISLEVMCPQRLGAKQCMQTADALLTKLAGGVEAVALRKLTMGGCRYEADADCFCCKVSAQAEAYVYALANEDETEFTDFMLKGEVR